MDTFHSTDAGVAYLVTCGEGKIYHAGDLHDWVFDSASERENRQMTGMYRHEIDKMKIFHWMLLLFHWIQGRKDVMRMEYYIFFKR